MNINLTLIGQLIAFVAFVAFCMRYVWPPIAGAMAERQNRIADGLAAADRAGHDLEVAKQQADEQLADAKKMIANGKSPAKEKARDKARVKDAETFGAWAEKWLRGYQMAGSTRDMRRAVYERELKPKFGNQKLVEITQTTVQLSLSSFFRALHAQV